jgi:integrase
LAFEAQRGVKYATISRRVAAIHFMHLSDALESPTSSNGVRATLKGIRRTLGMAPLKKTPATSKKLVEMVRLCPHTLQGKRDQALLLLGFAGAFRRSELVGLSVSDLAEEASGLRILIRRSKTDQEGSGQNIAIARGEVHCPVAAVLDYLESAEITEGFVFRAVGKSGNVRAQALSTKSVAQIIKKYAALAGFEASNFAGHSLRSGFLTSAAEAGANVFKMLEVSRHRSLETVRGYVQNAELFKNHAGSGLL